MKTYYRMLKGLGAIIDVQRIIRNIKKIAGEANITTMEVEGSILSASINNQMMNATNISKISEDLRYLVQSNIED